VASKELAVSGSLIATPTPKLTTSPGLNFTFNVVVARLPLFADSSEPFESIIIFFPLELAIDMLA